MTHRVVVMGPNLPGNTETFHVHRFGCSDTRKAFYRGSGSGTDADYPVEVESLRAIVEFVYDSEDFWEGEDPDTYWPSLAQDFKVFPCVEGLPDEVTS